MEQERASTATLSALVCIKGLGSDTKINKVIKSAENLTGFSETKRQLLNTKDKHFFKWFAGIMDGDGNIDITTNNNKRVVKRIRIKFHIRDVKILNVIQNHLHMGRIKYEVKKPYVT